MQPVVRVLRKLQRPIEDEARRLDGTEDGEIWAEASYLIDLQLDAAKAKPDALVEHYGSPQILTRHLCRLYDEALDVINNKKNSDNLNRCLRLDLKMIKVMVTLEKAMEVQVGEGSVVA